MGRWVGWWSQITFYQWWPGVWSGVISVVARPAPVLTTGLLWLLGDCELVDWSLILRPRHGGIYMSFKSDWVYKARHFEIEYGFLHYFHREVHFWSWVETSLVFIHPRSMTELRLREMRSPQIHPQSAVGHSRQGQPSRETQWGTRIKNIFKVGSHYL